MSKPLYNYCQNDLRIIQDAYFKLATLGRAIGSTEREEKNLWYFSDLLQPLVEREFSPQAQYIFVEQAALKFLEIDQLNDLQQRIEALQSLLSNKGKEKTQNKNNIKIQNNLEKLLPDLFIDKEVQEVWTENYIHLSEKQQIEVEENIKLIIPLYQKVLQHAKMIAAVVGFPFTVSLYSVEEIKKSILEKQPYDLVKMVHSLQQYAMGDGESYDIERALIELVKKDEWVEKENFEWEEALMSLVILSFLYNRFDKLATEEQKFLLTFYFYSAIVLGIPVRTILGNRLLNTESSLLYTNLCQSFVEILSKNQEVIDLDNKDDNKAIMLQEIFANFMVGGDTNEDSQKMYAEKISKANPSQQEFLTEALSVYINLREGTLVNWLQNGLLTPDEEQRAELARLFVYFDFNEDYNKLIEYFQNKPKISVQLFLEKLAANAELSDEKVIENCTKLISVLKENKLVEDDQELIIFNEQTGQFEWNENMFKQPTSSV